MAGLAAAGLTAAGLADTGLAAADLAVLASLASAEAGAVAFGTGTLTVAWHLGHLPLFPAALSGTVKT